MPGLMLQQIGSNRQHTFFDIRVVNPFVPSYRNTPLAQCYRRNELEKKRAYDQRVREIEYGSFSPLVFSTTGGMGTTATVVYKRLASMISGKESIVQEALHQSHAVDQMQAELFSAALCRHVASVDLDPQDTTLITTPSAEALFTSAAKWTGYQTRTEQFTLYTGIIMPHKFLLNSNVMFSQCYVITISKASCVMRTRNRLIIHFFGC